MVDTYSSACKEISVKTINCIETTISESVINNSCEESNSIREMTDNLSGVPKIVIVSNNGSCSTYDPSYAKDTSNKSKNKRRDKKSRKKDQDMRASVLGEGQRGEVARSEAAAISSELRLQASGWTKLSLAAASKAYKKHIAMERADLSPSYTSDEWEADSTKSDTDDDHTDSSDDDDPKSQVDRLIERGTLMYMDGENSALSSEDESDDSDYDYDSESDITDVSPLVSATASPLGLSPVLPRRSVPTSPLALHDNRDFRLEYDELQSPFNWDNPSPPENNTNQIQTSNMNHHHHHHDSTNMDLLLQAVIELENKNHMEKYNMNNNRNSKEGLPNHTNDMFIHPIRDNPHHIHLRKNYQRRKNMTFSNEEVRKIDRDNKILLKKIMAAHTRNKLLSITSPHQPNCRTYSKNSANKKREEKIRRENLLLLKKIQEVKPSKEVVSHIGGMEPLISSVGVPRRSLNSSNNSCGAFLRSIVQPPHVTVPPPRKETAL